jgi:hypothetical protein
VRRSPASFWPVQKTGSGLLAAKTGSGQTCITPLQNAVQDSRLGATGKWAVNQPLMTRASNLERSTGAALDSAHSDYCKHHNLEAKG